MLVGLRNNILVSGILIVFLFMLALFFSGYIVFRDNVDFQFFSSLPTNTWWFTYELPETDSVPFWSLASIPGMLLVSFIAGLVLRILFKKTASPELFFFILFLFSFAFEGFRFLNIFFHFHETPQYLMALNSRLVYGGRIFGTLMLLCSSLYALEFRYQKFEVAIGVAALTSLVLAYALPIDSSLLLTNFLHRLGDEKSIFFIIFSFALFTIVNYLIAVFKRQVQFLLIVLAVFFVLSGREILFFATNPFTIGLGMLFIISGTIVFSKQIDKIYLWF